MKKVFIRFFTVFLVLTIVLTGVAFSFSAEETTFYFDKTAQYMWSNYLNTLCVIDEGNADLADLRADGTPYKTFYNVMLTIFNDAEHGGSMADAYYMNTYKMDDGTLLYDYVQDIFGAYAYVLRGGKQKAVDYWNSKLTVGITMDDNGYTYTTAATQTVYDKDAYQTCLASLQSYMKTANDNYCFNVENGGKRYLDQKTKFETLCAAIDACAQTTPAQEEATVTLLSGTNYSWLGYVNVINVIPDTEIEGLRADGTPYKVFINEMLAIMNGNGTASDAAYMNSYAMSDGTLLKDYVQDTFGAYAYVLRGGRQKAANYWNSKLSVALTLGDNSYTYTNAGLQGVYDATAYQAAVDALNDYMANTGDASCFDVENGGGRFFDQRTKYNALVSAVDACAATSTNNTLVDFAGVTTSDVTLNLLITFYNNVDVVSIKADADVQKWAKALKEGVVAGKSSNEIFVGATDVITLWETTIRYTVKLGVGAKRAADDIFNDSSLWPLGASIDDLSQTVYKSSQYNEVRALWVKIRKDYQNSTTVKTSEVLAACEELKTKIKALELASLPFTEVQKKAALAIFDRDVSIYGSLIGKSALEIYQERVARITLDSNKATDIYKNYVAILEKAEAIAALDWENGTSASYPSVEEIQSVLLFDDEGWIRDGQLENDYYPFREAFGLDNTGYDALIGATYNAWVESGKYTAESLADVKARIDKFEAAGLSGNRSSNNTDAGAQEDIEYYTYLLVEKPLVEPTSELKIKGANISLQKSLAIYFAIDSACIEQYTDLYAEFIRNGITTTSYEIIDAFSQDIVAFKFSDIAACEAGDDITVVIHGLHDGREYKSEPFVYSVKTYCYNMLSKSSVSDGMKRICVDLLDYCAASQTYFKYQTEALVNSDLTSEQRAFGSDSYEELSDKSENTGSESDEYKISGFNLVYEDVIKAMVAIKAPNTDGLAVKVTFGDSVYTYNDFFDLSINGEDYYVFYFTEILPNKFRQTFTITFEVNGVVVGGSGIYSVESYLARRLPKTTDVNYRSLLEATAKYGDSCRAYFG